MKHRDQILSLLRKQIGNDAEVKEISETAEKVVRNWVNPLSGGKEEINGLVYGLVQSGKTGVLTVTGAMGADEGYRTLIIQTRTTILFTNKRWDAFKSRFPGLMFSERTISKMLRVSSLVSREVHAPS